MTIKELSKYHDIKTEVKQLEDNIVELETTIIGSSKITGMSFSSSGSTSNPTERLGAKLADLKSKLMNKKDNLLDEANKIEDFLTTVDDNEIRIIIRKRFLEGKTWNVVSQEISSDRSTPYYRLKKYLKARSNNVDEDKKDN